MSEWKERALQKKKYRRGGIEPDPPRVRHKKYRKPFRLEYFYKGYKDSMIGCLRPHWGRWGKYRKFEDAEKAMEQKLRTSAPYGIPMYSKWRIVDTRTSKVIAEREVSEEPQ